MKIQVIDCNYLFVGSMVKEIKNNIIAYHHGFMVVNDKLYLPLYQVLQRKYNLPKQYRYMLAEKLDYKCECCNNNFNLDELVIHHVKPHKGGCKFNARF